jgi:serine protease Do
MEVVMPRTGLLETLSERLSEVAALASPAVVGVGPAGSGWVTEMGRVATNAHNLHGRGRHGRGEGGGRHAGEDESGGITVSFVDGRRVVATVVGEDGHGDLAVLEVDTGDVAPLEWSLEPVRVGGLVVAVANPGGRGTRVTPGFVSAVDVVFGGPRGTRLAGAFEHTAPLARGSSGSPVVDGSGRVIGVNTHRLGDGAYVAMGADASARETLEALGRGEVSHRPRLGVALAPSHVANRLRRSVGLDERPGLLVRAVEDGAPADAAGMRSGDLIVSVASTPVSTVDELSTVLVRVAGTGTVDVVVVRGAEEVTLAVDPGAAAGA